MLSRQLLYISAERLFFFAQSISKLPVCCESSTDWAFPALEEELLFPVEGILCLHTLLWACLLCHLSVPKGVLLNCRIEAPVDRLSPKAETIPFEQNTVFVQYCVKPAPWVEAPHHSKQINCSAAYLASSSQHPVTSAFPQLGYGNAQQGRQMCVTWGAWQLPSCLKPLSIFMVMRCYSNGFSCSQRPSEHPEKWCFNCFLPFRSQEIHSPTASKGHRATDASLLKHVLFAIQYSL